MKKIINRLANYKYLLFLIVLFGFLIRFYSLGTVPGGFHADEAAFGYNAYSLLHTGKDEYGKILPLVLKSFGDYKGALYAYLDVPFILFLGLTPIAVRLPSIIFDTLTIFVLYFFIKELVENRKIALIASFLYAISPWSINISRTTGDVIIGVFFSITMAYAIQKYIKNVQIKWLMIAMLSGFAAILAYAPFRFFVVVISSMFLLFSIRKIKNSINFNKRVLLIIGLFLFLGFLYSLIASVSRFNQISIFSNPQTELVMQEQIREDQFNPVLITRIFHNKIVNYTRTVIYNAQQYFTLDFLALNGGYPQRERIPGVGLFYLWEIPFLLIGIYFIIKNKKRNEIFLILWWILLLAPSFITFDEIPNVHRTLVVLPAMCAIISIGIYNLVNNKSLKSLKIFPILAILFLITVVYEFSYFSHQYFVHFDSHQPWYRGYAYEELVNDLNRYYPKYKKIVITKSNSSPYIYILFYSKYNPQKYQAEGSPRDLDYTGFDKYYFVPLDCPLNGGKTGEDYVKGSPGILYVDTGTCITPTHNVKLLDIVKWKDGSPAFKLMEYVATGSANLNP